MYRHYIIYIIVYLYISILHLELSIGICGIHIDHPSGSQLCSVSGISHVKYGYHSTTFYEHYISLHIYIFNTYKQVYVSSLCFIIYIYIYICIMYIYIYIFYTYEHDISLYETWYKHTTFYGLQGYEYPGAQCVASGLRLPQRGGARSQRAPQTCAGGARARRRAWLGDGRSPIFLGFSVEKLVMTSGFWVRTGNEEDVNFRKWWNRKGVLRL